MEEKKEDKIPVDNELLSYIFDIAMGFFVYPFLYFIVYVSVLITKCPKQINDGIAVLYVALLTGLFFFLRRKSILVIDTKKGNLACMLIGLVLFFVANIFFKI